MEAVKTFVTTSKNLPDAAGASTMPQSTGRGYPDVAAFSEPYVVDDPRHQVKPVVARAIHRRSKRWRLGGVKFRLARRCFTRRGDPHLRTEWRRAQRAAGWSIPNPRALRPPSVSTVVFSSPKFRSPTLVLNSYCKVR